MNKTIFLFFSFAFSFFLRLDAQNNNSFETLQKLISYFNVFEVSNKPQSEIMYIFFENLSSTFSLDMQVANNGFVLEVHRNDSSKLLPFNDDKDISKALSSLNIFSNQIESILHDNKIDMDLESYLCDFIISRVDNNRNSRVYTIDSLNKPSDNEFSFEFKLNNKYEYEIYWLKNTQCSIRNNDIQIGDIIHSINGIPARYLTNNLINNLLYKSDSIIDIVFLRDTILIKESIKPQKIRDVESYQVSKINEKTVLLKINTFLGSDLSKKIAKDLHKNSFNTIIIDLRNNHGGYIEEITKFIGLFLNNNDTIVMIKSPYKIFEKTYLTNQNGMFRKSEVLILINNSTASGANIVAGALKTKLNATIIGEKSFGINTIHKPILLFPKRIYANIPVGDFSLPSGEYSLDESIVPDAVIKDCYDNGEDAILEYTISSVIKY